MLNKINLLNHEDAEQYAKRLGFRRAPHVVKWLNSTFVRWLKSNEAFALQCVNAKTSRSPQWRIMSALWLKLCNTDSEPLRFHMLTQAMQDTLPEWAAKALADHELWWWETPATDGEVRNRHIHWVDYLATLPERDIRMTVDQLTDAVAAWDKQLARQKLLADLTAGTAHHDDLNDTTIVVRLSTQEAYKAEGAVMRHCVATYWGRKSIDIYSVRTVDAERPLATIEVQQNRYINQIRGFANGAISEELRTLLTAWAARNNFVVVNGDDDEEYEDDGDYEEEEEDDDEDVEDIRDSDEEDDEEADSDEEDSDDEDTDEEDEPDHRPSRVLNAQAQRRRNRAEGDF